MRVFIAVASGETQHVKSFRACLEVTRRGGDQVFLPEASSYGSVTRMAMLDAFYHHREFDAFLALDGDQAHPRDLLEKLRDAADEHDLDMVCAHYYKRQTDPVESLCWQLGDGTWPFQPYLDPPTAGLHEIAATGLGCVLIRRRVIEAVWAALPKGDNPFRPARMPEIDPVGREFGSDMRFFILARRLGFKLWLRADVESPHAVTIWLTHRSARVLTDYNVWSRTQKELFKERLRLHGMTSEAFRQRLRLLDARKRGLQMEFDAKRTEAGHYEPGTEDYNRLAGEAMGITIAMHNLDGRMAECQDWIEWLEKYPAIEYPKQLPTGFIDARGADTREVRAETMKEHALDLVSELPDVESEPNGHHE